MTDETNTPEAEPKKAELPPVPVFDHEPAEAPLHMVVTGGLGATFVAQSDRGEFRISLRVPEKVIRMMEDLTQRDQFDLMLKATDQGDLVEKLGDLDSIDAKILRSKFFQAHYEREQARLGEFFGSSDS